MQTAGGGAAPARIAGDIGKNAAAGEVGEYIKATVAQGAAVALATNVPSNVTSIALPAGDWDVSGVVDWLFAGTTSYTALNAAISIVSAALPTQAGASANGVVLDTDPLEAIITPANVPGAGNYATGVGPVRVTVPNGASPATIFLVAQGTFTVAALSAFGTIRARRVQ